MVVECRVDFYYLKGRRQFEMGPPPAVAHLFNSLLKVGGDLVRR